MSERRNELTSAMSVNSDLPSVGRGGYPYEQLFGRSDLNLAASTSVIEGLPDEQRTSPVRRSFLLLMLFDLLLCFVLWIVYVQESISSGDIIEALSLEVKNYTFRTSLFDTVVLAFTRFVVVEIVYGIFLVRTPWFSGAMTGLTCCVLFSKCFLFDFHKKGVTNTGLGYAVLIAPLILTWVETTFLICRVIPQEKAAAHVASCLHMEEADETQSLFRGQLTSRHGASRYTASVGYYTPQGSVFGDDYIRINVPTIPTREAAVDVAALLNRSSLLQSELWYLYRLEIWGPDPPSSCDLSVRSSKLREYGPKVFRMEALLDAPAQDIYHDMVYNVCETPAWNSTMETVERIQSLPSENIDVIYNVVHEALAGAISRRDFVLLRTWGEQEDLFYIASASVEHPKCPPTKNCVRAEQLISACVIEPLPGNVASKIVWIMCNDLKIFLPQRIIDRALDAELPQLLRSLQERAKQLKRRGNQLHPLDYQLFPNVHRTGTRSPRHRTPVRGDSLQRTREESLARSDTQSATTTDDRSKLLPDV